MGRGWRWRPPCCTSRRARRGRCSADGHKSLEPDALSSSGLLLDRHDLQDLILQGRSKEEVNDLV